MNTKVVVSIAVVILLLVGGGVAYKMMKSSTSSATTQASVTESNVSPTAPASTTQNVEGTMKDLMTAGKSEVCTYSNAVNGTTVNGKLYVTSGKMRGDFASVNSGNKETVNSHILINDMQTAYAWTDLSNRGVKIAISAATATASNSGSPDMNQKVQFSCQGWTPDDSMFTVPTTVTFYSMKAVVPPAAGGTAQSVGDNATACAACAKLPAAAQQMCKSQLNCQ
jgi:hypothetical protein